MADGVPEPDTRNVADHYKGLSVDAIRADLARSRTALHVAVENLERDFNVGSIVRTANAFNVAAMHIIGRRQWNKRGAMVTDRYLDVRYHPDVEDFVASVTGYEIVAVDNLPGAEGLAQAALSERSVLVFGSEKLGLSDGLRSRAARMVMVEQRGSTRSINVGAAAAVVMYQWQRQHVLTD